LTGKKGKKTVKIRNHGEGKGGFVFAKRIGGGERGGNRLWLKGKKDPTPGRRGNPIFRGRKKAVRPRKGLRKKRKTVTKSERGRLGKNCRREEGTSRTSNSMEKGGKLPRGVAVWKRA